MKLKIKLLVLLNALSLLQSCGWGEDRLTISPENVESVKLVLYYSDGDFDWKNVGEIIVIDSGELLQVRRNLIRPDAQYIVHRWDENLFLERQKNLPPESVPLRLDRKNGVVCNATNCTTLYAICPSLSEMRKGQKKCVSFSRD